MAVKTVNYSEISPDERVRLVEEIFVMYPLFEKIIKKFEHCHQHSKISAEPAVCW